MLEPGQNVQNRYVVLEKVGRGGMAVVYKAYQPALERYVALKVLPRELAFDHDFAQRFHREARAAARLTHPHIVTIHDVGQEGDTHFIVMEYLVGRSLTALLAKQAIVRPERAAQIVFQTASALDYAHSRGIVHRDVKPANILLDADGAAKLTDFGIVKAAGSTRLTRTGTLLGTPAYMSPEQARGEAVGPGTDVYSLGIVAYEMLLGRVPFSGDTAAVLHAHVYDAPDLSLLPRCLQRVVGRALKKDPEDRYATAGAFAEALRTGAVESGAGLPQPPSGPPDGTARRSLPAWLWGVGGAAATLIVVLLFLLLPGQGGQTRVSETPEQTVTLRSITPSPTTEEPVDAAPSVVPSAIPSATPEADVGARWSNIGRSVQGRLLHLAMVGDSEGDVAIVVTGSIQGDQPGTRDLVGTMVEYLREHPRRIPEGVLIYFLPSLNPDGNASNSRFNANDVDLNRNWDTVDWRSAAAVPGHPEGRPGSGGSHPFSEPETRAARDLILGLKHSGRRILVVVFHSSVRRDTGEVYAGGHDSLSIAERYASSTRYDVKSQWAEYAPSGTMVTWCAEQAVDSINVVIPTSQGPFSEVVGTSKSLLDLNVTALLDSIELLKR